MIFVFWTLVVAITFSELSMIFVFWTLVVAISFMTESRRLKECCELFILVGFVQNGHTIQSSSTDFPQ